MARLEFELDYLDLVVQHFNHFATVTPRCTRVRESERNRQWYCTNRNKNLRFFCCLILLGLWDIWDAEATPRPNKRMKIDLCCTCYGTIANIHTHTHTHTHIYIYIYIYIYISSKCVSKCMESTPCSVYEILCGTEGLKGYIHSLTIS